jgi:apolipoprotein N-acyltransferase
VLGGFPWVLLGSSQAGVTPVVQAAALVGVYGLSALIAFVSAAVALLVAGRGRARWMAPAAAACLVGGLAAWGAWRVHEGSLLRGGQPLRVALVQGNVLQDEKWNKARATVILNRYLAMTREGAARGASLIVWPESSTPFMFEHDSVGRSAITRLAQELGVAMLFGSDQYEAGTPPRFYNAAFLVGPDGETKSVYRKMHLVPFGEFVPLKRLLFFVAPLVESVSDFSPGEEPVVMPLGANRLSTAICYEVVYPDLVAAFTRRGSQLLTTITNDAWYGYSSAPHQHFWQATLRAVEHGRYLVRSANTGISGIVDPYGRVTVKTPIFEQTVATGDVRYLDGSTLYARTGDAFAYACGLVTLLAWWGSRRR